MAKNGWKNLVGTTFSSFRLGFTGVRIKDVSGVLQVRNSGDTADANLKSAGLQLSGVSAAAGYLAQFDASGNVSAVAPSGAVAGAVCPNGHTVAPYALKSISGGFAPPSFNTAFWLNYFSLMSGLNAEAEITLPFAAGDWSIHMLVTKASTAGDTTCYFDGVSLGFTSGYNASNLNAVLTWTVNGVTAGLHTVNFKITGHQPSSSGYTLAASEIIMRISS